jgi:hypothetical protein
MVKEHVQKCTRIAIVAFDIFYRWSAPNCIFGESQRLRVVTSQVSCRPNVSIFDPAIIIIEPSGKCALKLCFHLNRLWERTALRRQTHAIICVYQTLWKRAWNASFGTHSVNNYILRRFRWSISEKLDIFITRSLIGQRVIRQRWFLWQPSSFIDIYYS